MRNVADIKKEDNLNFILPMRYDVRPRARIDSAAVIVVIHLHYKDSINFYMDYVRNIPKDIKVLFTTSDPEVAAMIEGLICGHRVNYQIVIKENRGRDISAFLVTCRGEILKYEYCCFLHDKKEKHPAVREDVRKWVYSLWENTIGSEQYILNVLNTLASNPRLGVLVPPKVLLTHSNFKMSCDILWSKDYALTEKLAEELGLRCNLDPSKTPITIGTVFWAKTSALKKLLQKEWRYEDFLPEPLPEDGTISHAVERILAYVAQDAGYDTGWVMTDRYAGEEFEYMQEALGKVFSWARKCGVGSIAGAESFERVNEELTRFCEAYEKIFIYGKGVYGQECLTRMRLLHKKIDGFLVTSLEGAAEFDGIPVHEISEKYLREGNGIIIAVSVTQQAEIVRTIQSKNAAFSNLYHYDGRWNGRQ